MMYLVSLSAVRVDDLAATTTIASGATWVAGVERTHPVTGEELSDLVAVVAAWLTSGAMSGGKL